VSPDRAALGSVLVGLAALAVLLVPERPIDDRILRLVGVPREGWYEADDLGSAAAAAGGTAPVLASAVPVDGDVVRLVGPWAIVEREPAPESTRAFGRRLSLNQASVEELEGLPGVGPALAARIVAARPYLRVAQLDGVKGIGPARLRALAPLVEP
jgi:DNA uptake protein ComE-like DNA-binding protein